ncbi:MAG TPA: GDP-mannose 4,6-dehydratase, partial [Chlamydiales bacterium]|nr:GDP-mannose 4,6-dehydratase [Chlamydiales bacterium]
MRILVAGGAGFLGSHLCEKLLEFGHTVIAFDNLITGSIDNVMSMTDHPNFAFVEGDICVECSHEVDAIYNLACPASPIQYQHDP